MLKDISSLFALDIIFLIRGQERRQDNIRCCTCETFEQHKKDFDTTKMKKWLLYCYTGIYIVIVGINKILFFYGVCGIMLSVKECQSKIGEIRMNIKISNVAKVLEANISIKGISVIAGLNNTGKSTVLKSIYIGLNSLKNTSAKVITEKKKSISAILSRMEEHFDNQGYAMLPQVLLIEISSLINENIDYLISNPDDYGFFKKLFLNLVDSYSDLIEENRVIYTDEFIKPIYDQIRETLVKSNDKYIKYISEMYLRNTFGNQFNNEQNKLEGCIEIETENVQNHIRIRDNKIQDMSFNLLRGPEVIYIPTYNILDYVNVRRVRNGSYSPEGDIRNYIRTMRSQEQSYEDYIEIEENINSIKDILEEVVHGKLEKLPSGELQYMDSEMGNSFNIGNVASGMKTFLLIQSLVESGKLRRNSILLIDEPETNLHPEWHLIFAEILVLMYKNMGIVSVVNSHSPYFIRALEVQMANYEFGKRASYYLMEEDGSSSYVAKNVTNETNKIYEKLYKPLEYL